MLDQVTLGILIGSELVELDIFKKEESLDTGIATVGTLAEGVTEENADVCPTTVDTVLLVLDESNTADPVSEVEVTVFAPAVASGSTM